MTKRLRRGDRVSWSSHGSTAHGTVVRRVTRPVTINGHTARPTPDHPEYVVRTDDGAEAVHHPEALRRDRGR
jgi:hypothetical protein